MEAAAIGDLARHLPDDQSHVPSIDLEVIIDDAAADLDGCVVMTTDDVYQLSRSTRIYAPMIID